MSEARYIEGLPIPGEASRGCTLETYGGLAMWGGCLPCSQAAGFPCSQLRRSGQMGLQREMPLSQPSVQGKAAKLPPQSGAF